MTLTRGQPVAVQPEQSREAPAEALAMVIQRELRQSPYPAMRRLNCRWCGGKLVLEGHVQSFFLKQTAQAIATRLAGALAVENQVAVGAAGP